MTQSSGPHFGAPGRPPLIRFAPFGPPRGRRHAGPPYPSGSPSPARQTLRGQALHNAAAAKGFAPPSPAPKPRAWHSGVRWLSWLGSCIGEHLGLQHGPQDG